MHDKVLSGRSRKLLARLEALSSPELDGWTIAGGTGLALHLGHRRSDDFDFFRINAMNVERLYLVLRGTGAVETLQQEEGTLTVLAGGVKLSFSSVPDPFLFAGHSYSFFQVADPRDIALMKLAAISSRGSRKDFIDLYTIFRGGLALEECFAWLPRKYGKGRLNTYHLLESLTYFDDAEREPMPRMLEPFDWRECKAFFVREAHALVLP